MNRWIQWLSGNLPRPIKKIAKVILSPMYYFRILVNDVKALLGITSYPTKVIFVAGYPKSGTTWVENFISNIPGYNPRVLGGDREILRQHGIPSDAFKGIPKYGYSAIKTHASPEKDNIDVLIKNGVTKVLVMYRDPRDIIVSQYYHVLKDNPWKADDPFYADYNKMSKEEAMSHSMHMVLDDYPTWINGWLNVSKHSPDIDCLIITYEDLRSNPIRVFKKVLLFFGIELSEKQFHDAVLPNQNGTNTNLLASREPGMRSTKRKGAIGEWKKELNAEQIDHIKDKLGHLLISLGYEDSLEW